MIHLLNRHRFVSLTLQLGEVMLNALWPSYPSHCNTGADALWA